MVRVPKKGFLVPFSSQIPILRIYFFLKKLTDRSKMPPKRKETSSSASKKRHSRGREDIISSLSDNILLEILSFLDMKYAVQTTILSKRWRDLWTSLRRLKFDAELFHSPTKKRYDGFRELVDQVLILRDNSDIDTFHLISLYRRCYIKSRLNTWILAVIRRKVGIILIDAWSDGIQLPNSLFTCNSLTKLMLSMPGSRRWSIALPDSIGLPNLVFLELFSVSFNDENLTNNFFLSCPNLAGLIIEDVEFLHINVNISCLKLNELQVNNHSQYYGYCRWPGSRFKLHAPGLSSFSCKDYMSKDYILENLSSLVWADIDMKVEEEDQNQGLYSKLPAETKQMYSQRMMQLLRGLLYVEDLKISAWFLEVISGSLDLLEGESIELCDLTCLRLETCLSVDTIRALAYLLKISPNVESLFLEISQIKFGTSNIGESLEAEVSLQCLLDKLEFVEIEGAVGCADELKFLESLLKNAKVLKKLVVYTSKVDSPDLMKFTKKLLTFPKASSDITILFF